MGRYTISRFVALSLLLCAVTAAAVIPVLQLNLTANARDGSSQLIQISKMVFAILPTNPVESFMTGNTLQIVVISMIAGVGLLMIGERGSKIQSLVNEGSVLTQHIVTYICRLVPLFVFAMLLQQIWTGQLRILLTAWNPAGQPRQGSLCQWCSRRSAEGLLTFAGKAPPAHQRKGGIQAFTSGSPLQGDPEDCMLRLYTLDGDVIP